MGGGFGENGYMHIYMAESLQGSPETSTTLLISYISIQNKKFKKNKWRCSQMPKKKKKKSKREIFVTQHIDIYSKISQILTFM